MTLRLLAVVIGLHIGCVAADAPPRRAVPTAPRQTVEFTVWPRITRCPGMVKVLVRVHEPGPEWECVAENVWWGDGERSGRASCDPGDRALRVYDASHIYRRSGKYQVDVEYAGVSGGEVARLFRDHTNVTVEGGLRC